MKQKKQKPGPKKKPPEQLRPSLSGSVPFETRQRFMELCHSTNQTASHHLERAIDHYLAYMALSPCENCTVDDGCNIFDAHGCPFDHLPNHDPE